MQHVGSAGNIRVLTVLVLSLGLATGGCPDDTGSSEGVQPGVDPAGNSKSVLEPDGKSEGPEKTCGECHAEQVKFWGYGGHAKVPCAECHNIQDDHISSGAEPSIRGNDQCMECHDLVKSPDTKKMSASEILEHHLRVVEKKHVIQVRREKVKDRCVYCHDPHLGQ